MKRTILLYGLIMALLALLLKWMDYRLFVRDISMEVYVGLIATISTILGIWMGLKLTSPKIVVKKERVDHFTMDEKKLEELGISQREYDVLLLMAEGLSNKEIGKRLFISLNTVKTHASNLFSKLDAKRRTQAVQQAKQIGIIP